MKILWIGMKCGVKKRQHVFVKDSVQSIFSGGHLLFQPQQLLGLGGQAATEIHIGDSYGEQDRGKQHQRMVARRGRSAMRPRTKSRTRRAIPSACNSYCARSTSCAPWSTYSSG